MKYVKRYDPQHARDPEAWLALDEAERTALVLQYHRRARVRLPNARLHATIHVVVENQVALGDEIPVRRTLERLRAEGSIDTTPFTPLARSSRRGSTIC